MKHAVCRLCDHAHSSRESHVLIGGPVPSKSAVALAEPVTVATGPMSRHDAIALTEQIRRTADDWCRLVYEAHEREAWRAMGYKGWLEYVYAELPMSRSRAYQLLTRAKIALAIGAGKSSTMVELPPERQTRAISGAGLARITKAATVNVEAGRNQLAVEIARDPGVTRAKAVGPGHYPGNASDDAEGFAGLPSDQQPTIVDDRGKPCEHQFRCAKCGAER